MIERQQFREIDRRDPALMAELCELVEVVTLIAKLLIQLSEIRVDNDFSVHTHVQNEGSHRW